MTWLDKATLVFGSLFLLYGFGAMIIGLMFYMAKQDNKRGK